MRYYQKRSKRAFHARVAGFVDYVTSATPTKIDINVEQNNFNQLLPLMMRFRYFKAKGLSVMAQPATTLPLNPMQIGSGAGQVKATDILTPCAVRRFYNEFDTVTADADGVTQVLSDQKWKKFLPQRGFRMYFKPYMYGVGSTATGPLRMQGRINTLSGQKYYETRLTGPDGNDANPSLHTVSGLCTTESGTEYLKANDIGDGATSQRMYDTIGNIAASNPMDSEAPNWPDGTAPIAEAWGAWGGIKPIGIQPTRRSIDGKFSFPMLNLGRIFMPGYTSVTYTWRLWWTLYVDLYSPKYHLEPGDLEALGASMMAQRETVFATENGDITGTLYDSVQDPATMAPEELPPEDPI